MTVTDLNSIKDVAITLLYTDIHETEFSPVIVSHPFTNSGIVPVPSDDGGYTLVNIVESGEHLDTWQNWMAKRINESDSVTDIYIMVNKPYIFAFIKLCLPYLSKEDLSELWQDAWIRVEFSNDDANLSTSEARDIFIKVKDLIMTDDESDEFRKLPDVVTVYRGVTGFNDSRDKVSSALSWTLSRETAEFFAKRWKDVRGFVYECTTPKSHILALLNGRNEHEVILDPRGWPQRKLRCIARYENT